MLRLLIADDERAIRESIYASIDWASLGITVIGLCRNGVEAYDAILDEYPDIVLTDIKMPGLTGLELVARAAGAQLNTQFVILSGYAEFEFAKEAMRWGVRHYLLKPTSPEQIHQVMLEVTEDCYRQRKRPQGERHTQKLALNMRQSLLQNVLTESLNTSESLDALVARHSQFLDFENVNYELCFFYYTEPANKDQCLHFIKSWHRTWAGAVPIYALYANLVLIVFFESYSSAYEEMDMTYAQLQFEGQSTQIEYERIPCVNLQALLHTLVPKIVRFDTVTFMDGVRNVQINNYARLIRSGDAMVMRLSTGNDTEKAEVLRQIEQLLKSSSDVRFLAFMASGMLVKYATLCGNAYALHDLAQDALTKEEDPEKLRAAVLEMFRKISGVCAQEHSGFIGEIKDYVRENISSPKLSLKWLAENRLYMNVDYLSKRFALKTGEKFSAYLTRKRIEKAKELLRMEGNDRVYDIAEQVGCGNNPQYFSQIFKREVGMTPTEYMRKNA